MCRHILWSLLKLRQEQARTLLRKRRIRRRSEIQIVLWTYKIRNILQSRRNLIKNPNQHSKDQQAKLHHLGHKNEEHQEQQQRKVKNKRNHTSWPRISLNMAKHLQLQELREAIIQIAPLETIPCSSQQNRYSNNRLSRPNSHNIWRFWRIRYNLWTAK